MKDRISCHALQLRISATCGIVRVASESAARCSRAKVLAAWFLLRSGGRRACFCAKRTMWELRKSVSNLLPRSS
jgi:hypothetical protein